MNPNWYRDLTVNQATVGSNPTMRASLKHLWSHSPGTGYMFVAKVAHYNGTLPKMLHLDLVRWRSGSAAPLHGEGRQFNPVTDYHKSVLF